MKKAVLISLTLLVSVFICQAQKVKRAAIKTPQKTVIKPKTKLPIPLIDLYTKGTDEDNLGLKINKGDKLVYAVDAGGNKYNFIVTLNDFGAKGIDFNYEMTNANKTKGHVHISPNANSTATKYVNYFRGGELDLTNAISVWLSQSNFSDMPTKKTQISFDGEAPETFYRPEKDEVTPAINFKGKNVNIDGFIINNKEDGTGDKTIWIHNASTNTLILKMDIGFTIELKEIK
jgi:hypothetical protein